MREAEFPLDVQWTDIDIMASFLDFTYDEKYFHGLPKLIRELQANGMHYVNIMDPGISSTQPNGTYLPYVEGIKRNLFITKFNSTELMIGKVRIILLNSNCHVIFTKGMARLYGLS